MNRKGFPISKIRPTICQHHRLILVSLSSMLKYLSQTAQIPDGLIPIAVPIRIHQDPALVFLLQFRVLRDKLSVKRETCRLNFDVSLRSWRNEFRQDYGRIAHFFGKRNHFSYVFCDEMGFFCTSFGYPESTGNDNPEPSQRIQFYQHQKRGENKPAKFRPQLSSSSNFSLKCPNHLSRPPWGLTSRTMIGR